MVALPAKNTTEGLEARVLLAECRGPSFASYSLDVATNCMKLMDAVLWNRVDNPKPFLAKSATLIGVVTAPGQFAGFGSYPNYDHTIVTRIQAMLDIANNSKDSRSGDFADFINAAIAIANDQNFLEPSPGKLSAWRTAGSSSPGSNFTLFKTVLGNDFYYL